MNKYEIFDKITNSIIQKLHEGVIPWRKSWQTGIPANYVSKRYYNGINFIYLGMMDYPSPYYLTFLQCKQRGGCIKQGEEGSLVVFWKLYDIQEQTEDKDSRLTKIPILRYSYVFNLQQTSLYSEDERPKIISAETIIENLNVKPVIINNFRKCYYSLDRDLISIPVIKDFDSPAEYYSSLFHEIIHWTGHANRLGRKMTGDGNENAFEELVAEIGSAYLCGMAGIMPATVDNQAAYINSWLRAVSEDNKFLVDAAIAAKKAVNYLIDESLLNINCNLELKSAK